MEKRKKRQNGEFRMQERIKDRERKRKKRENMAYLQLQREKDLIRKRKLRANETYRQKERERDVKRKRELRKNEDYRRKEKEKDVQRKKHLRKEETYVQKECQQKMIYRLNKTLLKDGFRQQEHCLRELLTDGLPQTTKGKTSDIIQLHSGDIALPDSLLIPEIILQEA